MAPLIEHADEEEEAPCAHPVVEHLVDAPLHALHVEREHAEHHVAQVAHARKGHQPLHVGLHHADDGPVDDADDGKDGDKGNRVEGRFREEGNGEPQETVSAHLEEHPCQDHAARGRCLGMCVGKPRMHREHGHLDGEGEGEGAEEPVLEPAGHGRMVKIENIEGIDARRLVILEVEGEYGQEHQARFPPW